MHDLLRTIKMDDFNKHIKEIIAIFEAKDVVISSLREEINFLKNKYDENEEIKKLKKRLREESYKNLNGFPITEEQVKEINEWKKKHEEEVHGLHTLEDKLRANGTIGGMYSYSFIPTSIGTSGKIKCFCGAEFEFQEIE